VRLTREIFRQQAMQKYAAEEIQPGASVETDEQIDAFIREHCESAYHPCGTCRMGSRNDPMAVVDHECKVIGIENLRLADSSIMPQVTNGNLNAPTLMIGEKASDHILGRDPLRHPIRSRGSIRMEDEPEVAPNRSWARPVMPGSPGLAGKYSALLVRKRQDAPD
jgi:choline dehydrogenase-like flavoprotein